MFRIALKTFPKCWLCKKPVDSIGRHDEPGGSGIVITVRCHGQEETVRIRRRDIEVFNGIVSIEGWAFRPSGASWDIDSPRGRDVLLRTSESAEPQLILLANNTNLTIGRRKP